jgi:hypothetical protein
MDSTSPKRSLPKMDEEDLFCFEEEKEDDLFDFEMPKSDVLTGFISSESIEKWVLVDAKLVIPDQENESMLEGRLGILSSKIAFKTTEKTYIFEDDGKPKDTKKVDDQYYWNFQVDSSTWIQFQIKSEVDARVLFPEIDHQVKKSSVEDDPDESTLIPMTKYEEKLQIATETRDRAIRLANLEYEETLVRLTKEFQLDDKDICGLCCDVRCNVVIFPCLHRLCKCCSSRIGNECPWDRVKFTSLQTVE